MSVDASDGFGKLIALINTSHNRAFQVTDPSKFNLDRDQPVDVGLMKSSVRAEGTEMIQIDSAPPPRGSKLPAEILSCHCVNSACLNALALRYATVRRGDVVLAESFEVRHAVFPRSVGLIVGEFVASTPARDGRYTRGLLG